MKLETACQELKIEIEGIEGRDTVVGRSAVPQLRTATLHITARDITGQGLDHKVLLDDSPIGGGRLESEALVPACKYRIKVTSGDLGGFVEDVAFADGAVVRRNVVLAPGPDMVRLPGGKFSLGPDSKSANYWGYYGMEGEEKLVSYPPIPVDVAPFDMDRTEVTAEQWMLCYEAAEPKNCSDGLSECGAGCPRREEEAFGTSRPSAIDRVHCNVSTDEYLAPVDGGTGFYAELTPGREHHPVNCVARWQAEDYCRWVGKRLPTPIEWEYAARSGNVDFDWPWGANAPTCEFGTGYDHVGRTPCRRQGTASVCSFGTGDSALGLCDLAGNVSEYTTLVDFPPARLPHGEAGLTRNSIRYTCMGPSWRDGYDMLIFSGRDCWGSQRRLSPTQEKSPEVGFRCVRDVTRQ